MIGVFLIRAFFVFRKERNLQTERIEIEAKYVPINSEIVFVITVSLLTLIAVNYLLNIYMY